MQNETLPQLAALLPVGLVHVRWGMVTCPCSPQYVISLLASALQNGHLIDRTNEDGPIGEWDGWLVVHSPEKAFIETTYAAQKQRPDPG